MSAIWIQRTGLLILTCAFVVACGVKEYRPVGDLSNPAWVQIDGSESRRGCWFFCPDYETLISVWQMYPDTCESFFYGQIKAKKNRSTKPLKLPSHGLIQLAVFRISSSSSSNPAQYTVTRHSKSLSRRMYINPKPGHRYEVKVSDRDRDLYDFTLTEVGVNGLRTDIPLTSVKLPEICKEGFTDRKRLR